MTPNAESVTLPNMLSMCHLFFLLLGTAVSDVTATPVKREESLEVVNDEGQALVLPGKKGKEPVAEESKEDYDTFEVITDEDRKNAEQALLKELLTYAGYTLLVVAGSVFTVVCFLMDPRACIVAFASGSPCCLLFPCYRNLMQYTDPAKLIRANVNVYVPGIYIEEGGTMKQYPPSPEEMDCLYDLVSEFLSLD